MVDNLLPDKKAKRHIKKKKDLTVHHTNSVPSKKESKISQSSKEEKNPLDDGYYEAEVSSKLEFKNFPFQVEASVILDKRLAGDL